MLSGIILGLSASLLRFYTRLEDEEERNRQRDRLGCQINILHDHVRRGQVFPGMTEVISPASWEELVLACQHNNQVRVPCNVSWQ